MNQTAQVDTFLWRPNATPLHQSTELKLATKLQRLAATEDEQMRSDGRSGATAPGGGEDLAKYVADRLQELRPGKRAGEVNATITTVQLQGGISKVDVESLVADLQSAGYTSLDGGRVIYPKAASSQSLRGVCVEIAVRPIHTPLVMRHLVITRLSLQAGPASEDTIIHSLRRANGYRRVLAQDTHLRTLCIHPSRSARSDAAAGVSSAQTIRESRIQ